jgi:hypothetical protein
MRPLLVLSLALLASVISACQTSRAPSEEQLARYRKVAAEYDTFGAQAAQSVAYLGEPLKGLNQQQQASVAALLILVRVAAETSALGRGSEPQPIDRIWSALPDVCPPIRNASFSRGGCLDADLAYASAQASCLKKGRTEADCDRESAPLGAVAVQCHMKELQERIRTIRGLPGRRWPPGPFPWPTTVADSL